MKVPLRFRASWVATLLPAAVLTVWTVHASEPPARSMAVTVDDLPAVALGTSSLEVHRSITTGVVGALSRHRVPAVGFVNEGKLDRPASPERVALLKAWLDAGLELGNHTRSHPDLHRTPLPEFLQEVSEGETVLRPLLGARGLSPRWFRHPFLHTGRDLATRAEVHRFLASCGYRVAPVTIDNSDWVFARAYDEADRRADPGAVSRVRAEYLAYMDRKTRYWEDQSRRLIGREIAQVLLLHANRLNAVALDDLLSAFRDRGYRFVSLERALEDPAYAKEDVYCGAGGISWIHRWAISEGRTRESFAGEPATPDWVKTLAGVEYE